MTSPSLTLTPFSNWPTATTSAVCGFSLAVSGSTIPEAVVSSRSTIWTSARSPKGLNFIRVTSLCLRIFLRCPARRPGVAGSTELLRARDCNRECCFSQLQAELCRELVLRQGSYRLLGDLPLFEAGDGRDARDAVVHRCGRIVVHVDLDERHVLARLGHLLEDWGDAPARHAPRRPEIYYNRPLRPQNVALESRVRYFGYCHSLEPPYSLEVIFAEHSSTRAGGFPGPSKVRYVRLSSRLCEKDSTCTEPASSSALRASKSPAPRVSALAAAHPAARRTASVGPRLRCSKPARSPAR